MPDMDDAGERSLAADLQDMLDHGVNLVHAEYELQKARAAYGAQKVRTIALLVLLAAVLVFFSLVALTVGLVIALTPLLTALGATFTVFGAFVAIAAILAWAATSRWRAMRRALSLDEAMP